MQSHDVPCPHDVEGKAIWNAEHTKMFISAERRADILGSTITLLKPQSRSQDGADLLCYLIGKWAAIAYQEGEVGAVQTCLWSQSCFRICTADQPLLLPSQQ